MKQKAAENSANPVVKEEPKKPFSLQEQLREQLDKLKKGNQIEECVKDAKNDADKDSAIKDIISDGKVSENLRKQSIARRQGSQTVAPTSQAEEQKSGGWR